MRTNDEIMREDTRDNLAYLAILAILPLVGIALFIWCTLHPATGC